VPHEIVPGNPGSPDLEKDEIDTSNTDGDKIAWAILSVWATSRGFHRRRYNTIRKTTVLPGIGGG
jgi:hypothetical protein